MKSDSNTEMDLLLRRHARRSSMPAPAAGDAASRSDEAATSDKHPDADEMNAYAEGELPSVARSHMIAHLADCDRCRAIVTNLALAANLPVKDVETDAQQSASSKRSWREWLAVLFAPPVIRYGVPALVILGVVGVVFLALREREAERQSDAPTYVARNDQREGQTPSAIKPEESPPLAAGASPTVRPGEDQPAPAQSKDVETAQTPAPADTQSLAKTKVVNKEENAETPVGAAGTGTTTMTSAPITSDESSRQEAARDKRDEDLAANEPRPAAPPPAASQPSAGGRPQQQTETDRLSQNRKDSGPSDDRPATSGVISNTATREAEEKTASLGATARSTEARRRTAPKSETMNDGADASAERGARGRSNETRSVGGRNFRRQGSAWVDTAYTQGRATVNVTRGSEQYRALVADEPGLRTIADQLGGEVVVVWKGRAYRIH
jgi:hypothetical protein